jgi:A/G-specific adenine glycosylase
MSFVPGLLAWYEADARDLPWRVDCSPYGTWVSEVMLQQTQVDTVIPYFQRWMDRFPDVQSLAAADEQEVLSCWEGLGYYSRAHNLHRTAKILVGENGGKLPQTVRELEQLPGIGPYTAAAIASIAFNQDAAAVDGNIRRVLARVFNVQEPARSREGLKKLWSLAEENLPPGRASAYNQALMDLGSIICTPQKPKCSICPIEPFCQARALGVQEERPVKMPRKRSPHHTVTAAVILRDGRVLLAQRLKGGLLGGLWEFPGGTLEESDKDLQDCLIREIREELGVGVHVGAPFGKYNHAYTHFKISLYAFLCELEGHAQPQNLESEALAWVRVSELADYPMGKVDRQIARKLAKQGAVVGGVL